MIDVAPAAKAAPIVKWAGGKTRLLPELAKRVPKKFGRYYEPFVGGAALFFHLAPPRAMLTDTNRDLIRMYITVRDDVDVLIRRLKRYAAAHDERHYYTTREKWNGGFSSGMTRAAAFIYLNKTCFNGLWRVNSSGEFNVPMGNYTDPTICDSNGLRAASIALARTRLGCTDYRDAVSEAERGDFVYFDSPYAPIDSTSNFTSYTPGGFNADNQRELADVARNLLGRGVHVMLSNSDTPLTRKLYRGFKIERVKCGRSINSNAEKRGEVNELIITGKKQ
jgi:DNA adenine methylase